MHTTTTHPLPHRRQVQRSASGPRPGADNFPVRRERTLGSRPQAGVPARAGTPRPRAVGWALFALWALATCAIAVLLGRSSGPAGEALSTAMVGLDALGAGCVVMVWAFQRRRAGAIGELSRMLMGTSCLL